MNGMSMSNNSSDILVIRDRDTPLSSCEARARLALERGEISREVYQSLMGITAEALLTKRKADDDDEEGGSASSRSDGDTTTTTASSSPRKRVTPCGTPPLGRGDDDGQASSSSSSSSSSSPSSSSSSLSYLPELDPPLGPELDLQGDYFTTATTTRRSETEEEEEEEEEEGKADQDREYSRRGPVAAPPPPPSALEQLSQCAERDLTSLKLKDLEEQGFSLSDRARRFRALEAMQDSDDGPSSCNEFNNSDDHILQFADACLKAYDPNDSSPRLMLQSDSLHDAAWQSRLGLTVSQQQKYFPPPPPPPPPTTSGEVGSEWHRQHHHQLYVPLSGGGGELRAQPEDVTITTTTAEVMEEVTAITTTTTTTKPRLPGRRLPKVENENIRSYDDLWNVRHSMLEEYKREHGNCDVPYRWPRNPTLGRWVQNQREFRKKGTLSEERTGRLVELGFSWSMRRRRPIPGKWGNRIPSKRDPNLYSFEAVSAS